VTVDPDRIERFSDGQPTTDPAAFFVRRGALLPLAGHKGYGLALRTETLAAVLSGSAVAGSVNNWLYDPDRPGDIGYFLLALDVGAGFEGCARVARRSGGGPPLEVLRPYIPGRGPGVVRTDAKPSGQDAALRPGSLQSAPDHG
jgi:Malate/L-lactate dehydrogenase